MIEIINWKSFQSYKDRKPPWVRLHRSMLDNFEFHGMSANARALLPMLWLLASEDIDPLSGCIRYSNEKIAFRLRLDTQSVTKALQEIAASGFILLKQSCIESVHNKLRDSYETVPPETETETETEYRDRKEEDGQASTSKRDQELISAFRDNRERLSVLFPAIDLDIAFEKMLATRSKSQARQFLNPYEAIIKWMQMEFKPKAQAAVSKATGGRQATFDAIDRVMEAAGGS